jgi:hypothetical protein
VTLEERGVIRFFEAEHLIPLVKLTNALNEVSDLAIDPQGRYLIATAANGLINLWDATSRAEKANAQIEDASGDWTSVPLIEPTANVIRIQSRMLETDSRGRVGVLYIESKPGDFRNEGALHFVDEDGGYALRERLEVDDGAYARRASWDSSSFVFGPDDKPVAVFRLRTAANSGFDGSIYVARRQARDQWAFETIHEHGNMGFYPLLRLDDTGNPAELFHFTFGGFYLVRSTSGDGDADKWTAELIGQQGDGTDMGGSWSYDGKLHMVFRVNRFNSDPGMFTHACWDGRELRREVVDPFQSISLPQVQFAPDGSPIVLVGNRLMGQAANRWAEFTTLPISSDRTFSPSTEAFAIDQKGNAFFVYLDATTHSVPLCEGRKDSWSVKAIAHFREGTPPNFCTLRLGPNGEPVVVVGCIHEPYGWVRVLRRKD